MSKSKGRERQAHATNESPKEQAANHVGTATQPSKTVSTVEKSQESKYRIRKRELIGMSALG